ncbi:hypothetical protein [Haloarchaeobius sp. HRN-SO-5]|uniref:hypothetical protein n=1 Tax=Haloarchaeobius sp. HRN-SO-5 TaxID=3446118 RepID=UPI003EC0927F
MLLRTALAVLALVEVVAPRRLVDFWMRLATKNDDVELRSWVYTAARAEGVLILLWLLTRGRDETGAEPEAEADIRVEAET